MTSPRSTCSPKSCMEGEYPWYTLVPAVEPLAQGDILHSVPFMFPAGESCGDSWVNCEEYDVIVMSQSCDLIEQKVDSVILSSIFSLDEHITEIARSDSKKAIVKTKNKLRRGEIIAYHLLNRCTIPGHESGYMFVDLKNPRSLPLEVVQHLAAGPPYRVRLCPPYREQLSQAFARVFMRVGLPSTIPEFTG